MEPRNRRTAAKRFPECHSLGASWRLVFLLTLLKLGVTRLYVLADHGFSLFLAGSPRELVCSFVAKRAQTCVTE